MMLQCISCNGSKICYNANMQVTPSIMTQLENGTKQWRLPSKELGLLHRDGAPAIEYSDGGIMWFQMGLLHREDGPAVEHANGAAYYWLVGRSYGKDVEAWAHDVLKSRGTTCISNQDIDDFLRPILRKQVNKSL